MLLSIYFFPCFIYCLLLVLVTIDICTHTHTHTHTHLARVQDPEFTGRKVVTFHCQRDYVFVRQHRHSAYLLYHCFTSSTQVQILTQNERPTQIHLPRGQEGHKSSAAGTCLLCLHQQKKNETSKQRFVLALSSTCYFTSTEVLATCRRLVRASRSS
jgi:hypothetical protein